MDSFRAWGSTPRLNRTIRISEKIDGSNAAVCIDTEAPSSLDFDQYTWVNVEEPEGTVTYYVWAQSRSKVISPGKQTDNYGFAAYVHNNAHLLAEYLGAGRWFGEWAGLGIQKAYPTATEKTFWLFPQDHLPDAAFENDGPLYSFAPILYEGPYDHGYPIDEVLTELHQSDSIAYPGCDAEGIIVEWLQARLKFKITLVGDEQPKSTFRG